MRRSDLTLGARLIEVGTRQDSRRGYTTSTRRDSCDPRSPVAFSLPPLLSPRSFRFHPLRDGRRKIDVIGVPTKKPACCVPKLSGRSLTPNADGHSQLPSFHPRSDARITSRSNFGCAEGARVRREVIEPTTHDRPQRVGGVFFFSLSIRPLPVTHRV